MANGNDQKELAFNQFLRRVRAAKARPPIDNSKLYAESPMYYYCEHCGIQVDFLPEDFLFPPYNKCSQCIGLRDIGWLAEAIAYAQRKG